MLSQPKVHASVRNDDGDVVVCGGGGNKEKEKEEEEEEEDGGLITVSREELLRRLMYVKRMRRKYLTLPLAFVLFLVEMRCFYQHLGRHIEDAQEIDSMLTALTHAGPLAEDHPLTIKALNDYGIATELTLEDVHTRRDYLDWLSGNFILRVFSGRYSYNDEYSGSYENNLRLHYFSQMIGGALLTKTSREDTECTNARFRDFFGDNCHDDAVEMPINSTDGTLADACSGNAAICDLSCASLTCTSDDDCLSCGALLCGTSDDDDDDGGVAAAEQGGGGCDTTTQQFTVCCDDGACCSDVPAPGPSAGGGRRALLASADRSEVFPGDVFIYSTWDADEVLNYLTRAREAFWIDDNTRKITVDVPMYAGEVDLLINLQVTTDFALTGELLHGVRIFTVPAATYGSNAASLVMWDVIVVAHLIQAFICETIELLQHLRHGDPLRYFGNVWNAITWAHVVCLWIVGHMFISLYTDLADIDKDKISSLNSDDMRDNTVAIVSLVEQVDTIYQYALAALLLLALSTFELFDCHPRLAILSTTIKRSASKLFDVALLLSVVLTTFMVGGHLCFGQYLSQFGTLADSAFTLFAMSLGEFYDFSEEMMEVNKTAAMWFVVLFMLIVYMIILNLVLAIIVDSFEEAKTKLHDGSEQENQPLLRAAGHAAASAGHAAEKWVYRLLHRPAPIRKSIDLDKLRFSLTNGALKNAEMLSDKVLCQHLDISVEEAARLLHAVGLCRPVDADETGTEDEDAASDSVRIAQMQTQLASIGAQLASIGDQLEALRDPSSTPSSSK